jgi:Na+/H+-dicarboxylate symporter
MAITQWIILLTPIGVFSLIVGQLLSIDDIGQILGQLGFYFMTVMIGLFVQGFVVLPIVFLIFTRRLPFT